MSLLSPFPSKLHKALGSRSRSKSAIFAGVAALILAMGITVPSATSASAAEVDAVTDVATAPDPGSVRVNTQLDVMVEVSVPDSAKDGDTFTVNLASQIEGQPNKLTLTDDAGAVIAKCEVTARNLTCTFTDYVETRSNVKAQLKFPALGRTVTKGSGLDFTTGVGTEFHTGTEIVYNGGGLPTKLYKLYDANADGSITYRVGLSGKQLHQNGLRIDDLYDSRTVLDKGSISSFSRHRLANGDIDYTPVFLERGTDYTVSFDDAERKFTVDFAADVIEDTNDYAYWVFYTVFPDDSVNDGDILRNTAISGDEKVDHELTYRLPSGGGSGSVGSLSWSKVDENGDLLEGAEFKVTGPNGYEKTIVDNGDLDIDGHGGRFSVDQLPKGDYSVKEIKAPTGYVLSDEERKVTLASGGGMTQTAGKFVNVKASTGGDDADASTSGTEADASTDGSESDASTDGTEADASTNGSEADASTDGSEADASTDGADSDAAADTGDAASGADGSEAGASANGSESDSTVNADSAANSADSDAASNSDDGGSGSAANGSNGTASSGGASNDTGSNGATAGSADSGSTSGSNGGSLPRTGVETLGMIGIAAALMALGVAVVFLARRRAEKTD